MAQYISLPAAAADAFQRLASDPRQRARHAERVLDVTAIALAACIPIYGVRGPGGPLERLSDDEIARGTFCDGAVRLSFGDGLAPVEHLAVAASDLERAIERLGGAGVSFAHAVFDSVPRFPRAAYMFG